MTRRFTGVLLVVALAGAGVATGVPYADQQYSQSTTEVDAHVEFGAVDETVERGGTLAVPLELTGTDNATVRIGLEDVANYSLVVTAADGDGDGEVTIEFDTAAAGEDDPEKVTARSDADSAVVRSEVERADGGSSALPVGQYTVELYEGHSTDSPLSDALTVVVEESDATTGATRTSETSTTATGGPTTATGGQTTTDVVTEPEPTTDDSASGVPGFGATLALVALGVGTALAVRR